jgi:hypothetical protein
MPNKVLTTAQREQLHYIAEATGSAAAMIRELEYLQPDKAPPPFSMGSDGFSVQAQLLSLLGMIERITIARTAEDIVDLIARAKTLLLRLGNELEQLSSAAERVCNTPLAPGDRFGISSIPIPFRSH